MPLMVCEDDGHALVLEWFTNTFVGRRMHGGLSFDWGRPLDREVSSLHAAITWNDRGRVWQLRDLGSSNGTYVDGVKLEPHAVVDLGVDNRVTFGGSVWRLTAVGPPPLTAQSRRGERRMARDDMLLLPDEHAPEVVVIRDGAGWSASPWANGPTPQSARPVRHGETVQTHRRSWTLSIPATGAPTVGPTHRLSPSLDAYRLFLEVSANGEQFETRLEGPTRVLLPDRVYFEMWWILARAHRDDVARGLSRDEVGWVDKATLFKSMGVAPDDLRLNIWVHRSRELIRETLGVDDYKDVVERRRRRGKGQLRLGFVRIDLVEL